VDGRPPGIGGTLKKTHRRESDRTTEMIPLLHDFHDEQVLVFGGGPVGARKARRFAREAEVLVVSTSFDRGRDGNPVGDGDTDRDGEASGTDGRGVGDGRFGGAALVRAAPDPDTVGDWLDRVGPALVVAATDDTDLNAAVESAARERDVLVNRADDPGPRRSDSVVVPATVRDGPVVVAVATGARSPALSRHLRRQLEGTVENAGEMAELAASLRAELADRLPPEQRRSALRAVVRSDDVWKALDSPSTNQREVATDVISDVTGETT
jgi:precorrin-2 dehydrogenase/sirohydrochlorin ferrochelatase